MGLLPLVQCGARSWRLVWIRLLLVDHPVPVEFDPGSGGSPPSGSSGCGGSWDQCRWNRCRYRCRRSRLRCSRISCTPSSASPSTSPTTPSSCIFVFMRRGGISCATPGWTSFLGGPAWIRERRLIRDHFHCSHCWSCPDRTDEEPVREFFVRFV